MIKLEFSERNLLIFLGFTSFIALLGAYISQFGFNLQPCILCLYQRKPFFAIITLVILATFIFKNKKYQKFAFYACLILLFINILIAGYHVGVEQKIFKGPTSCSSVQDLNKITKIEDLKLALKKASTIKCSKPAFVLFGISMAGWNVIYCLSLLILCIIIQKKNTTISNEKI